MTIESRTERKLMIRLVSIIFLLYFFFSVDRGNVGFAGLQMTKSLGLTSEGFGLGSGLFTVGYLLLQVPNAAWLRRLGGGRAFASIAFAWGIVSTLTALVPNQFWFLINRFLLGVSEAGFNAFVIYYINQMFPPRVRGFAIGLTLVAVPVSLVIASPLSGALLNSHGASLQGGQLLFLVEGMPTVRVGLAALRLVPATPRAMAFLTNEERDWLVGHVNGDHSTTRSPAGQGFTGAVANPLVWALGYILFTTIFMVNVMLIWMPQIIHQMSHAGNQMVGWLNSLPWISLGTGVVLMARISDRVKSRATVLSMSLAAAAAGFLLTSFAQRAHPLSALAGLLLAAFGTGAAQGVFWALTMELIGGIGAATGYAVITVLGNGSGVFANPLIGKIHDATGSFATVSWALAAFNLGSIAVAVFVARRAAANLKRFPSK